MNPNRHFKDAIYEQFARIGKAVSSSKRLELLDLMCQTPRTVEALASESGLTIANTSRHLQILRGAGLIEGHKEGVFVTYRLTDQAVCEFYRHLRILAEHRLADIEQITHRFLEGWDAFEAVDREELIARVRQGSVTVIDVRPLEEYRTAHLPGAIPVPLKELESRLAGFDKTKEIVAYCRGPFCVLAIQAVAMLRARGFHAVRLEEGVQDWRARGFAIATGMER
jgi:rhodanese-related sulfurtransferase